MRVPPPQLDEARLRRLLAGTWGVEAIDLRYAPVGYGSHHWVATTAGGERRFVTVDELAVPDREPQLGQRLARLGELARLRAAMRSAVALRADGGLEFVVASLPGADGELVATLDDAFAVAVLPFVDGRPWPAGTEQTEHTEVSRAALTFLLGRLHDATSAAAPYAERDDLQLDARADLEDALDRVGERWDAGPYAAQCRALLEASAGDVRDRLGAYDGLAAGCRSRGSRRC